MRRACILFLCLAPVAARGSEIRLSGIRFDPVQGLPAGLAGPGQSDANDPALKLVQHDGAVSDVWRDALAASGAEILDYVPHDTYLVWMGGSAEADVRARGGTRAVVRLAPALKLTPHARALTESPDIARFRVGLRHAGDPAARVRRLEELGVTIERVTPLLGQDLALLTCAGTTLWSPSHIEGEVAKRIIDGSSGSGPGVSVPGYAAFLAAKGVDGSGVTIAVTDNGVDRTDPSGHLSGRVVSLLRGASEGSSGHGHHVAGILGGECAHPPDPSGYQWGSGVAPRVGLLNIPRLRPGYLGTDQEQVRDAVTTPSVNGVTASIASCSWGSGVGTDYTMEERLWDSFVRDADDLSAGNQPLFVSFSAGNAGPVAATLTRPHSAKNVVAVGNSASYRPAFGFANINEIFSGAGASSRGPAGDGRIKPDLVAPGTYVSAADSGAVPSDCGPAIDGVHLYCTGSSMAQPHVAGAAALFTNSWLQDHAGVRPAPALIKAALINGATDLAPTPLGPPFSTATIPNFDEGWGGLNLDRTVRPTLPTLYFDELDRPALGATGASDVVWFALADPAQPLRATLVWTDAPAAVGANPALVNDLDLVLQHGSTTWLGNSFRDGFSDPAALTPDRLNNVESVAIRLPPPGVYSAGLAAAAIAGDGIPGNGDPTDQDFALVIANAEVATSEGHARLLGDSFRCSATAPLLVYDRDVSASLVVLVDSTSEPGGESVVLVDTTGQHFFSGSIELAAGPATSDGKLQVQHGDTIRLLYVDADDGKGGLNVQRTATATVDCVAPAISNVRVTRLTDREAMIEWDTDEPASSQIDLLSGGSGSAAAPEQVTRHALGFNNLSECGRYHYSVTAIDSAGNAMVSDLGGVGHLFVTWGRDPVFFADFEGGDGGFTHWGPREEWQWGAPVDTGPPAAFSGDRLWGTDLGGNYAKEGTSSPNGDFILLSPAIDLTGRSEAWLRFRQWFDLATDGATDDGAWAEVWDGTGWTFVTPSGGYGSTIDANAPLPADATGAAWAGRTGGWRQVEFDLSAFSGRLIWVKLHLFEEDNFLAGSPGWYIDDFEVFTFAGCERGRLAATEPAVACGQSLGFEIVDSGLNLDSAVSESVGVRLRSASEPSGELLVLVETGTNSSRFRAYLPAVAAPPLTDGSLSVATGDTVEASYLDADDGSGRPAAVTAMVPVDCDPPAIGLIEVSGFTDRSALISWQTNEPATSIVEWGTGAPLTFRREDRTLRRQHAVRLPHLSPCARYLFRVSSSDVAGSNAVDDNRGAYHAFDTWTGDGVAFFDDFERDNGWTLEGEWQRDIPDGLRLATGSTMDPNAALSGLRVLGIDVTGMGLRPGNYEPGVALEQAISPRIDCSRLTRVELRFARWLGVGRRVSVVTPADRAALDISADGGMMWTNLWENPITTDVNDRFWSPQSFDITAIAAGRSDVRLRFTLASDSAIEFMGWQVDDLWVGDPARAPWAPCGSALSLASWSVDDSLGNSNGVADPGESVRLRVRLANDGTGSARTVAADLRSGRSDLGSVTTEVATFPDIAAGAASDSSAPHFGLTISPAARCGDSVPLTIAARAQDSAATLALELPVGSAAMQSRSYVGTALPAAIPDGDATGVASTVVVTEDLPLAALEVTLDLTHPSSGDLVVTLTAPDGSTVWLHNLGGGSTPFATTVYPMPTLPAGPGSFTDFLGRSPVGTWTLRAIDARSGLSGQFVNWTLKTSVPDPTTSVTGGVATPLLMARQLADVMATWGAAAGAVGYSLLGSAVANGSGATPVSATAALSAVLVGAATTPGSRYYRVAGVDSCGRMGP